MSENNDGGNNGGGGQGGNATSFTQEQVNDLLAAERRKTEAKFSDYEDLKSKVGEFDALANASKSAEQKLNDRLAALEAENKSIKDESASNKLDALRMRIAAKHKISDDDAGYFLTGTDEASMTAQAERLVARETAAKQNGNYVPGEGKPPAGAPDDEMREFARSVFGNTD